MSVGTRTPIWGERAFLLFFLSTSSSSIAGAIATLLIPIVALENLNASESDVGMLRSAQLLPFLFLSVPLGLLVDRRPRRGLMLGADLGRTLLLAAVAYLAMIGTLNLPGLVAFGLVIGSLAVIYELSYLSATPDVVSPPQLQAANRATEIAQSGAGAFGPALAGALAAVLGSAGALLFSAGSYLASCLLLGPNRWEEKRRPAPPTNEGIWVALTVGVRFVAHSSVVRGLVIYLGAKNIFVQAFQTALLLLLVQNLNFSTAIVGFVLAVNAIGFLCGAAVSPPAGRYVGVGAILVISSIASGAGMLLVGIPGTGAILPIVGSSAVGVGSGLFNIQSISVRQTVTPAEALGRTNAVVKIVSYTAMSVGAFLGGLLSSVVDPSLVVLSCGVGTLLTTLLLLTHSVRTLKG